jgi:hypothetical protein
MVSWRRLGFKIAMPPDRDGFTNPALPTFAEAIVIGECEGASIG